MPMARKTPRLSTFISITFTSWSDGGPADVLGCIDENATNYDDTANTQSLDQYGNSTCIYASCDDVPVDGCIYVDGFGPFDDGFGPTECTVTAALLVRVPRLC